MARPPVPPTEDAPRGMINAFAVHSGAIVGAEAPVPVHKPKSTAKKAAAKKAAAKKAAPTTTGVAPKVLSPE